MTNFEDYFIHQLKSLHDLRTHHLDGILATPRDTGNGPAQPLIWQDFRLKGFPNKSFHAPRIPKYKRMSVDLMNTDKDDQYFGKTTHFDTARNQPPPGQGPPHSKSPHVDEPRNQYPVRDPLGQYTEEHKVKLQREMQDIEEDRKQRNIIDQLRNEERQEEKRKDKEMLTNYYPWGRPGGGAPRNDTRKQKFLETDIDGSPTPSYRERMEREGLRYNPEREDQERFHQQLDRQRNDQELRRQEDRLDNLQRELETVNLKGDQYGNHGNQGGGAPHRINSESFTERREPRPSIESPRRAPPTFRPENYRDNIGRSIPNAERLTQRNTEVLPLYHPFGRSGGGAPVKDTQGKIVTQLQGNLLMENYKYQDSTYDEKTKNRLRAREYYDFLKGQEEEQRRNKQEIEWHMKAPIGDLASIMGSKNVGRPVKDPYTGEMKNHHLGNSDVTLQKMNYQPKADTEKKKYHQDLSQLADERMRYRQLNRLKDNQEGMLHHHTMDSMWGKPGGGAPKGYNLRKFNLESQIHHPTKDGNPFTSNDEYSPRFHPNKYVRSTVQSTHANLYEYPEQLKDKNYALSEPYATY